MSLALALLPWLIVGGGALAVLLLTSVRRHHGAVAGVAALALGLAVASLPAAGRAARGAVAPLLAIDGYSLYFAGLVLAAALAVVWLAHGDLARRDVEREEFYAALLLSTLGAMTLVASHHLAALFLGLELLSVGLFVMAGYLRQQPPSLAAGIEYLVLASVSSAFLLLGIALVYAATGALELDAIATSLGGLGSADRRLALAGLALFLVAAGFKLALVPFHLWAPDVYEGAPAPSAAFLATASKAAMLAIVVRLFMALDGHGIRSVVVAAGVLAVASMLVGNVLALLETRIKRLLAYSSIAHLGYAMLAVLASGAAGVEAAAFYLSAYLVAVLAAFGVVAVLEPETGDAPGIDDYRGLVWRRPVLGSIFAAAMLSLAGIPATAGFVGKLLLLVAGVESRLWGPVWALVLGSAIGVFYYLRVVVALFSRAESQPAGEAGVAVGASDQAAIGVAAPGLGGAAVTARVPVGSALVLAVLVVLVIWLGTWPAPLLRLIESSVLAAL